MEERVGAETDARLRDTYFYKKLYYIDIIKALRSSNNKYNFNKSKKVLEKGRGKR